MTDNTPTESQPVTTGDYRWVRGPGGREQLQQRWVGGPHGEEYRTAPADTPHPPKMFDSAAEWIEP